MKFNNRSIYLSITVLLTLASRFAIAEQDGADANRLFQQGADSIRAGDLKSALAYFESAYAKSPHFAALYNIGMAHVGLGDASATVLAFERYLAEGQTAVPAERRTLVEAELRRQAALTGNLIVDVSPKMAKVFLDGVPLPPDRLGKKMRVNPGNHKLLATHQDYTAAERTLTVAKGEEAQVLLTLSPLPVAPTALAVPVAPTLDATSPTPVPLTGTKQRDEQPAGSSPRMLGYTCAGAGLLTLGVGLVVYLNGRSSWQSAIDNGCTKEECLEPGASYWQDAKQSFNAARILFITGGAVAAAGLVLVLSAPNRRTMQLSLAPFALTNTAGIDLTGHW
jgi:tetratricopeptide (TPR) repeat protein